MIVITEKNFSVEVEQSEKLCIIDLYADWCAPCRMIARTIEELEKENPDIKFCKINVDEEENLARAFGVSSIPMVAAVKNNTFIDASVGLVPKSALQKLIDENR